MAPNMRSHDLAIFTPLQTRTLERMMRASETASTSPCSHSSTWQPSHWEAMLSRSRNTRPDDECGLGESAETVERIPPGPAPAADWAAAGSWAPPLTRPIVPFGRRERGPNARQSCVRDTEAMAPAVGPSGLAYALGLQRQSHASRPASRRPSTCFLNTRGSNVPLREHSTVGPSSWFLPAGSADVDSIRSSSSSVWSDFSRLPAECGEEQRARSDEIVSGARSLPVPLREHGFLPATTDVDSIRNSSVWGDFSHLPTECDLKHRSVTKIMQRARSDETHDVGRGASRRGGRVRRDSPADAHTNSVRAVVVADGEKRLRAHKNRTGGNASIKSAR